MPTRFIIFKVAALSLTIFPTSLTSNAAPNPIEIISIAEVSSTSVEILFDSSISKKVLSYYVINAAVTSSVGMPKNIKKVIKTKSNGLITTVIKDLNPKAAYNFSVSAKTNKGKMINSEAVEYSSLSNLMDAVSNLPADWGNPKPIPTPTPTQTATPIAAPAFTLSSSSESRTVNTAATGFTITSTGGAIASFAISATPAGISFSTTTGALTGTPTSVAVATAYTITATNATGSATRTFTLTVTAVTCANGGICIVGDRGPGGGIVYYVSASNFTSTGSTCNTACKYLEVAPATWQSGTVANDLAYQWSNNKSLATGQDRTTAGTESGFTSEKLNWKIGKGFSNTSVIKVSGATSAAQAAVLAYAGTSIAGQWFIPSMNELNELCKYARGQTTGVLTVACDGTGTLKTGTANDLEGFLNGNYWSSSENSNNKAWYLLLASGGSLANDKDVSTFVRPVRAF